MKKIIGVVIVLLYFVVQFAVALGVQAHAIITVGEMTETHLLWLNLLFYAIIFILYIVLFLDLWKHQIIGFKKKIRKNLSYVAIGLAAIVGTSMLVSFIYSLLNVTDTSDNQQVWNNLIESGTFGIVVTLVISVLFAPLVEELVFRFAGFWIVKKFNLPEKVFPYVAIILTGFLFGLIHISGDSFIQILFYFALGIVIGFFYLKSKNILVPILIHMGWNLFVVLITVFSMTIEI